MQRAVNDLRDSCRKGRGDRAGWEGFPWLTMVFGSGALELNETSAEVARRLADQVGELIKEQLGARDEPTDTAAAPSTRAHAFTLALARDRRGKDTQQADDPGISATSQGEEPAAATVEPVAATVEPVAARMVFLALLLTEFFYSMRAVMGEPTSRWENEFARLTTETPAEDISKVMPLIRDARREIKEIRRILLQQPAETKAPERVREGVGKLLEGITAGLDPTGDDERRELRSDHLRLITEVAWYFLTLNTPIYPGWTDLLLNLMLRELDRPDRSFARPRPRYLDLRALISAVHEIYEPPTMNSWSRNMTGPSGASDGETGNAGQVSDGDPALTERDHLYRAAAQVLWVQHQAQQDIRAGNEIEAKKKEPQYQAPLPATVAFVTSFDVELDLALLASAGDHMFRVAVPVHVVDRSSDRSQVIQAELCWFLGDVVPRADVPLTDQIDSLMSPATWRLLTSDFNPDELRDAPIVIHLSGCPLFNLPDPSEMPDLVAVGIAEWPNVDFFHAVTVDEYLALRQSEAELIWSSDDSPSGKRNRALPQDLMINEEDLANPRFWLSMGVPVGDPAVRHRLVSQLTRQRLASQRRSNPRWAAAAPGTANGGSDAPVSLLGEQPMAREVVLKGKLLVAAQSAESGEVENLLASGADAAGALGAAVNTRIGDDETNMLYWMGWDVVEDDCNEFTKDLRHYTHHINCSGPDKQPSLGLECPLPRGTD